MLGKRCSCGQWHDTQGTLAEPIPRWNVLARAFVIGCFALMGAAYLYF
jgi:hypothetical protein